MAFNGTEGEAISLAIASEWTENYRNTMGTGDPKGHFFGKDILKDILNQTDCMGIRIYYGINDDDEKVLILAGAKANEDDITDLIADKSRPCPTNCGRNNELNS